MMNDVHELASLLVEELWAAGTRVAFGIPGGGTNLDVIGSAIDRGMKFVLAHGESSAVIMAATYGELTGVPGFCVVTRGPGAASAANGVLYALLDRDPLVLVTDCVTEDDWSRISHQRIDQHALLGSVAKTSARLGLVAADETIRAAVEVSLSMPWGPSHIAMDPGATSAIVSPGPQEGRTDEYASPDPLDRAQRIEAACNLLESARRPVLLVGVGARFEEDSIREFLEGSGIPVFMTYKARGTVPDSSPNTAGVFTGGSRERSVIERADLIITVGLDPVELIPASWPFDAPVLALSPWTVDSTYFTPTLEIIGPLSENIEPLLGRVRDDWEPGVAKHHRITTAEMLAVPVNGLAPHKLVSSVRRAAPVDSIATIDAGAHMLIAVEFWTVEEPGRLLISNGSATMGYALPAAIAAALVHPGRQIVCFVGDGGLGMTLAELETIARLDLAVNVVVFNDSALSLIEIKQGPDHGGDSAVRFSSTDFAAVAGGFGITAYSVDDEQSVEMAVSKMFDQPGPTLLDARIDASGYPEVIEALRGSRSTGNNEEDHCD